MLNSKIGLPNGVEKGYKVRYMGGHIAFPKKTHTKFRIYDDGVELMEPTLRIPYSSIIKIENMEGKKNLCVTCSSVGFSRGIMEKEMPVYSNSIR